MAGAGFLRCVWAICMTLASFELALGVGINWGTITSHPIDPKIVVNLLKDNKIGKVKLFDAESSALDALAGSNIEVMVGIPNDLLDSISKDYSNAKDWVKQNVSKHRDVNIRYVAVGNEPYLSSYNGAFVNSLYPALKNIQRALNEAGYGDKIKTVVPSNADVYESAGKPSDGKFRDDVLDHVKDIVKFFHDNDAPFLVNIYPFLSLYLNKDFPVDFAFLDDNGGETMQDNNITYTNAFEANHDTLVWALKKLGYADMKILIGEIGWPTDGDQNANVKLAKRFYDGFMKKLASKKGTPLRPDPLEVYLFGLFDENLKSIAPGDFERHWGIFRYDGQPKFEIDFTGEGSPKMPVGAKGVQYQEKKWCVYNKDKGDAWLAGEGIGYACSRADCTSLGFKRSCGNLDLDGNISYSYNMYFQMNDQDVRACDFQKQAKIVTQDPSTGDCLFPIQIVRSSAQRLQVVYSMAAGFFVVFWISLKTFL